MNKKYLKKLQRIQDVCARLVMNTRTGVSTEDMKKALHWLPVEQRIIFKINLLTYKCLNHDAPQYLQDLLAVEQLGRSTRSESTCRLKESLVRKRHGDRAFRNAAPSLWNNLPPEIRLSSTINLFKRKLKTHLFRIAYYH